MVPILSLIHVPLHEEMAIRSVLKPVMMEILLLMMDDQMIESKYLIDIHAQLEQDQVHPQFALEYVEMGITLCKEKIEMTEI